MAEQLLEMADEAIREVLPPGWRMAERRRDGALYKSASGLVVICSVARELDGQRWLHVSCSTPNRLPNWRELRAVKDLFIGRDLKAIQVLPRASEHVNLHPYVLHLFCPLERDPLPDFTRGTGSL